jgi:quercetin dioxygenase-like cupin family protein
MDTQHSRLFATAAFSIVIACGSPSPERQPKGAIILPTAGDPVQIGTARNPVLIKIDSATTGSQRVFAFQLTVDPGDSLPVHRHHRDDEVFFVHAGEVTALVGEERRAAPAGTTLFIPAGMRVGLENSTTSPATLLVIFAAAHMSEYIRSLGHAPGTPPKTLSTEDLEEIRRRHHITFP